MSWDAAALLDALEEGVAVYERDGTVVYANPTTASWFGRDRAELVGTRLWELFPEAVGNPFHEAFQRVAASGRGETFEHHYAPWDRWFENQMGVRDGKIYVVASEVTARKRAERRLHALARASEAFASTKDVPQTFSAIAQVLAESLGDMCGVMVAEQGGETLRVVAGHHVDPAAQAQLQRVMELPVRVGEGLTAPVYATGEPLLVRTIDRPAHQRSFSPGRGRDIITALGIHSLIAVPLRDAGRVIGVLVVTRDRTPRPFNEDDLALLKVLGDRAGMAIDRVRLYERLRATVHRLEHLQAVTSELSRARTPAEVAAAIARRGKQAAGAEACLVWRSEPDGSLELLASEGVPETREGTWQRLPAGSGLPAFRVLESGEPAWVETDEQYAALAPEVHARQRASNRVRAFAALPMIVEGRRTGLVVFSFALPHVFSEEEKQYLATIARHCEQALERAQLYADEANARSEAEAARANAEAASRAKDEFLAMLGHELRNPLAPIVTALELMRLRDRGRSTKEQQVIERQVAHLQRLVDDLLDIARITRGKIRLQLEPVELVEPVAKAIELASPLLEQKQHDLRVSVPRAGLPVLADPIRLAQVIANLITNAAKYTDARGRIELTATRIGDEVTLSVKDDGSGIEPELLPRVFDLFVQGLRGSDRGQGGLGLGLTLVRNLVQLHGGTISAASEGLGRGSEFVVRLPASQPHAGVRSTSPAVVPAAGAPRGPQRRVLVVDDNVDAAELIGEYLRSAGHDVVLAHDGPGALRAVEGFTPDVALLDIGLPVMDGYELASRLRARGPLRLAALTGYGQEHDRVRSRDAGFHVHFVKPVSAEALLRYVEEPVALEP